MINKIHKHILVINLYSSLTKIIELTKSIPNIKDKNLMCLCLDIENSSTIISDSDMYRNEPVVSDISRPSHIGLITPIITIPSPIPTGVASTNIIKSMLENQWFIL